MNRFKKEIMAKFSGLIRLVFVNIVLVVLSNSLFAQDFHTKVNTLKYLDYYSKSTLKTADIDGRWGINGDRLRIDYGLMKLNSSVVELKILNSIEVGEKLNVKCRDMGSMEDVDVWIYPDPQNEKKPILELNLKSKKQYLQFSFKEQETINKKTYFYNNLSPILDYKIDVQYTKSTDRYSDLKKLTASVYKKSGTLTARIENIEFVSYRDITDFRAGSMITSIDNGGGEMGTEEEFIVADFNFDGLADFAITNSAGGNQGSTFNYFLQRNDGTYYTDDYLTKKIRRIPFIDKKNKCLTSSRYLQMGILWETEYHRFNKTSGVWEHYQTIYKEDKYKEINNESKHYMTEIKYYRPSPNSDAWEVFKTENEYFD